MPGWSSSWETSSRRTASPTSSRTRERVLRQARPGGVVQGPVSMDLDASAPLRQFTGVNVRNAGLGLTGGNQGGLAPEDEEQRYELPEYADYTRRRPEQLLSQISEVMHHAAKAKDQEPVETQFGYGRKADGSVHLYASTNNPQTQQGLQERLGNPRAHLESALRSDDPQLSKVATKLLLFGEQQAKRREAIRGHPDEAQLSQDLDLSDRIHASFMQGSVNVVKNPYKRHAEQNIAEAMHASGHEYDQAEIAGTKIRCEGCSSELGYNLRDGRGRFVVGRVYGSQAERARHEETLGDVSRGRAVVATNRSERSRSHSPPPRVRSRSNSPG